MTALRILVLGGTAMLGREIAREAVSRGHDVTCLARGEAGSVAEGSTLVRADRDRDDAFAPIAGQQFDAVYDVARLPGHVARAVRELSSAGVYVFVSTCNVYAAQNEPGADESAALLEPLYTDSDSADTGTDEDEAEAEETVADAYGRRKVACEELVVATFGNSRSLIARSGLIGGPGDTTTRSGYWPMRFAASETVVVPDDAEQPTQLVDIRDFAAWLIDAAEDDAIRGVMNVVGDVVPLGDFLETARRVAGGTTTAIAASRDWLLEHSVEEFAGSKSMPLWLSDPEWRAFMRRDNSRAKESGLRLRPLEETLSGALEWERAEGFDRPRTAGMTAAENDALVADLRTQ
jgi:2'-hydroxyisoflavone reductase